MQNHKPLLLCSFLAAASAIQGQMLPIDSAIREGHLNNGLSYYIRHNDQTPGQADFYIAQRVGSILETPEQRGLAHFLEHMAFNGTKHFPDGNGGERSIRTWCERNGIKFGADLNASTSIDQTIYNIGSAPVTKEGVVDTCLLVLRDWSNSLLLNDAEIDHERGVIREEWRTRRSNMAISRLMEEALPAIYKGSKYEDCLPIGHIEVVDTFHYDQLRDYYKKWYRPELQAIIVVGDVDVDAIEAKIKDLFKDIPATKISDNKPERIYYPVSDNKDMIVYTKTDDEQPSILFSLYMKRDAEPRETRCSRQAFIDGYKSRLAMFILRQRLANLPKQVNPKLMTVSCRDNNFYISTEKDAFTLSIGLLPEKPKEGIEAAIEVVEKARQFGFTESELEHAKIQYAVSIEHRVDNKNKTRNREYVGRILKHFCSKEPLMDIEYEAELEAELAKTVTLQDVNEVIKDIVTDQNQVCIVFGPTYYGTDENGNRKPYSLPSKEDFKNWIETAQKKEYENDNKNEVIDVTFIKKAPKAGKIVSKKTSTNGYTEYLLSNGITVHARPSEIEKNRLTINMFRLGGQSLYPDEDAASLHYLASVIRESGASDFDFLTLEKKRRGKALRVTPYIDSEEEGVKGVCAASDLKTWLEVNYLYLTQPRRDDDIFKSIIDRQRALLKNRTANPNVIYKDTLRRVLYGDNKSTQPITEERLAEVSNDRIYEIYKERFSDLSGMQLMITGDIREEEFEELICKYVASLPGKKVKKGPFTRTDKPGKNLNDIRRGQETHIFTLDKATPSALTNIVYTADIPFTTETDLKIDVLSQIMRAIYTDKVREEKGGTYGVSVSSQCWKYPNDACSMTINFRCAPEKYEELIPIIDEQLQLMAKNGPTEEQLNNVKEYELKNYDRAILTNGWWEYVRYHELHDGIDFEKDYVSLVNALTPESIRDFCKLLLDGKNRMQVTMK
ncbi:MAG: insulinase family protein [Bacteroidaceae bacterium]|nr:insulinase family protein [Bacteroidaceae bacterium]